MALTSEQVIGLVNKIENAADADKRLAAIQLLEATLDGATEIPDSDAVVQILKVSIKNSHQAVSTAALSYLPSLFASLAAPATTHGRVLPSTVTHVRAAVNHLMPILIEKLGDQKERVREISRRALTQLGSSAFIVSPPPDPNARKGKELETPLMIFERLMRDNAMGAKAPRIKEQATLILPALKLATEDRFPVRLLLPSLVTLLSDADPSVREGSRAALVALFINAAPGAKAGLKKELERQDVRKALMDGIVKEVLAGVSAAPAPVSARVVSAQMAHAPATAAQAGSGSGLTGAVGAEDEDFVPPVYVASRADLAGTFSAMLPFFEGRESEFNWLSREQSILKIRGMLKTGAHVTYRATFVEGVKSVNEAILKAAGTLRTSMAVHACSLLGEIARTIGDSLDSVAETFMISLLDMAGLTKKIVAKRSQMAAREFFIHVPFKHSFATLLNNTMQEKTPGRRLAGMDHMCTLLQYQGSSKKHAMESHGSHTVFGQALKRGMSDQNKDVRAKVREVFWVYHAIWPAQAQAMLETADAASKKGILASVPPPGTVLLLTAEKDGFTTMAQQPAAPAAAVYHPPPIASAPTKKPSFSQSVGPGPTPFDGGFPPKLRSVASIASSIDSAASASAAPSVAPKRRAVGPSAALLAAKREATLRMRAEAAAEREREESFNAAQASGMNSQEIGDDSEGGDNWMADFKSNTAAPVSRSVFAPARPRTPPSASTSASVSAASIHVRPQSPPRFVPKYGHDAILASPPKKASHVTSFGQMSHDESSPTKIPLPRSPTSPRMTGSPRLMSSPRMRGGSGLGMDSSRFPRPSTDLLALASEEDADATQLMSMPGPDASIDLMMFTSSSPMVTPATRRVEPAMNLSDLSNGGDGDETTVIRSPEVEQLGPAMSSLAIPGDAAEPTQNEDASLTADMSEDADETKHVHAQVEESPMEAVEASQSDSSHGRDVEETVALQAHEATSTAAQLLNLLETPAAAAAAAAAASSPPAPAPAATADVDSEMTSTPRLSQHSRASAASPEAVTLSPDRSQSSSRGMANNNNTSIVSSPGSVGTGSRAGTPTSANRRSHLPRPVSMLHRVSSPLHSLANARHGPTRSVDLMSSPDALARLNGRGTGGGDVPSPLAGGGERDSRRSSVSSNTSAQLSGSSKRFSVVGAGAGHHSRGAVTSPQLASGLGGGPTCAAFDARPLNSSGQSAAVNSFLRRASRLEQGSPIKSKPEAVEWVAAIRDGTADLRTYKRLLKLTIDFRIGVSSGGAVGGELVPGRDAGTRGGGFGSGTLGLERMGDADFEEEEAGLRAWEEGNLFDELFVAICGSLQAPARIEELRTACFALLHRLVENEFPLFTSTGRELDLLALLFQLRKDGRKGKQTLDACEAILISWSARTDPMLGLGAVINNLKMTADSVGLVDRLHSGSNGANGNGGVDGTQGPGISGGDESTLRTLVMGLKVLGRLLLRLPGEVIEEELSRATEVLRMTLTHVNVELRRTAIETLVAANKQINNAATVFKLVGPLPTSQQDLLMYYFHKAGQQ
ncbi:hypothetical protein A4X09_0g3129 [Tilletia walkeri]|uniref:TOG domain-containing protein n=1 Tax=Tilletia walkeri TaxID=117179 RepID=A0A8X7NB75_9BASI|nr:hypothetical protein A4X09_0g3129 [Tilletia walkeri]